MTAELRPNSKVVYTVTPFQTKEDPMEQAALMDAHKVDLGMLWILQAIALKHIKTGTITRENLFEDYHLQTVLASELPRIEEFIPEVVAATQLEIEAYGYMRHRAGNKKRPVYRTHKAKPQTLLSFLESRIIGSFSDLTQETLEAKEKLTHAELLMVVGQQGVGKSAVTSVLTQRNFSIVSMSQIVREVTQAWGLREDSTIDKIIAGQILKEYFGADILVNLGVHYLLSENRYHIAIDGPRLIEEAQAVLRMGGSLIGVVSDTDVERDAIIRRRRIEQRALEEPARRLDILRFDEREQIEAPKIQELLRMVKPEHLIVNNGSLEMLELQVQRILSN